MAQRSWQFKIVFALLFFAVSIFTIMLTAHLGHVELARPILLVIAALAIVIIIYPELYRKFWFWIAMMIFMALQVPPLLFINWNIGWMPSPFLILFCLGDVAIMIWIISFIQKLIGAGESPK